MLYDDLKMNGNRILSRLLATCTILVMVSCQQNILCEIDDKNADSGIYDLDEAACFIYSEVNDESIDLELIKKVLELEEDYMIELGIIVEEPFDKDENPSNLVLDLDELADHVIVQKKVKIDREKLLDIYDSETNYLEFVGLLE